LCSSSSKGIIDRISWCFPFLRILNAIYVASKQYVLMHDPYIFHLLRTIADGTMYHIYYVVKKSHSPTNLMDELFVHLPFSLYHG
ncbi:hypothetical protein EDB85DRAFT_1818756, partial [Lactarius pseudohatsudake]